MHIQGFDGKHQSHDLNRCSCRCIIGAGHCSGMPLCVVEHGKTTQPDKKECQQQQAEDLIAYLRGGVRQSPTQPAPQQARRRPLP